MKVVLDTNVFVSALIAGGTPEKIVQAARRGQIHLVTSPPLLLELSTVLTKKLRWSRSDAHRAVRFLGKVAHLVNPSTSITRVRNDPSDNRVLECAVDANADYIVSGDRHHLLPLKTFRGIPIFSPRDFLLRVLYHSSTRSVNRHVRS